MSAEPNQPSPSQTAEAWGQPPGLSLSRRRIADAVCVALGGELDLATLPAADRELRQAQREARHVLLDLRALTFIDVCGLNMILSASTRARREGARVVVLGSPCVSRVLELAGVAGSVEMTTDADVALPRSSASAARRPRGV